jgi:hypothetical protein
MITHTSSVYCPECCDPCASLPDQITVVFSGLTLCPPKSGLPDNPPTLNFAVLTRTSANEFIDGVNGLWTYNDGNNWIRAVCFSDENGVKFYLSYDGAADADPFVPPGGGGGPDKDGSAFAAAYFTNGSSLPNMLDSDNCGNDGWAYGGVATLSWE